MIERGDYRPKIIIDGSGTERDVSPEKFRPIPVPENTIVFPDKKEVVVDWRRTFEKITEITRDINAAEIVQDEGIYQPVITHPRLKWAMGINFSDPHIGSYTSDHELIRDILDITLNIPHSFIVDTGDTFNNGIWGGLAYEDIIPPYLQAFTIEDMARELGDKYAACVIGNHPEWMFTDAGIKPEFMFARLIKGPIFPGMGLLHLDIGGQKYDWALAHDYWGKTKKNIFNVCINLRQNEYPNADIFSVGHEHIWGFGTEKIDERVVGYIRPGTAKLIDRYARIHGIARRGQAMGMAVLFRTDKKEFEIKPIDKAVAFMKEQMVLAGYEGASSSTV